LGAAAASGASAAVLVATVTSSYRPAAWGDALDSWLERPITGLGPGAQLADVPTINAEGGRGLVADAHDVWLNVAGQAGVIGLLTIVVLVGAIGWWLVRSRPLTPALLATGLGFAGVVLYQGLTLSIEQTRHVWVLLGVVAGVLARDQMGGGVTPTVFGWPRPMARGSPPSPARSPDTAADDSPSPSSSPSAPR
jgi:O-antigen ligase